MHGHLLLYSLRQRKWRHLLNAFAIAMTAAVVIAFVSIMLEFVQFTRVYVSGGLSRIVVIPKIVTPGSSTDGLPIVSPFSSTDVGVDAQSWVVVQGSDGVLHFGPLRLDVLGHHGFRVRRPGSR